jgi:pyruvate dehydrogenase E2 component (dihydrolipoamide acetyltransferase)
VALPNVREFRLPDIGEFENIDVVEVLVSPGDRVAQEDSLIVLESDKATMEVPSPWSAVVKEIRVAVGDQVSEGDLIALLEVDEEQASAAPAAPQSPPEEPVATSPPEEPVATSPPEESAAAPTKLDFSKFGPTELEPLNRIRKLSSANLQRSWVTVPHVTQFDEADITDLDAFRKSQKSAADAHGAKLTFLPFIIKACTAALGEFPTARACSSWPWSSRT